ncbi:uroporphyrinogen-III C-methyltransferase [Gilvimarinus sp. SDUM040013]|uniref:Uroporphyrinogen-III C-methyltransferase n=1 Tax=Gilvimarinus gilvus TaxID=3058038 RepID=A0ABU4S1I3_9GAMM|nr:uroporphyrinogen-III C-methyltransferase [Gilvimarinus sp. SDUM040013]MDO3384406.1 uroporphyrinogen-III C-methyltransferase [Gilvimarinus sp. SDUM040013]MDX6851011.1 uroporphyrinogen-III C-methyltransferase [Gilvimarinus sp. SDUM040013]
MAETPQHDDQKLPVETKVSGEEQPSLSAPPRRSGAGLAMLSLFLLIAVGGVGGWYGWQLWLQVQTLEQQMDAIAEPQPVVPFDPAPFERQLAELHERYLSLENPAEQARDDEASKRALTQLARQIASVDSRLNAMTGTSRNDWKLAEAAFLLRMANQKVLLEHNSVEALAMTRAADAILKEQDDPGLFAVRQVLADEMSRLQLAESVDKEGVYLRLQAIIDQIDALPLLQAYQRQVAVAEPSDGAAELTGVWPKVQNSVLRAWRNLGSLIRVTRHDVPVEPFIAPDQGYFLRQNLRLMLEQAQAALLRESQPVYQQSMHEAITWLDTYFALSDSADVLVSELRELSGLEVQVQLPDVDQAQRLLRDYIERLHKVQPEGNS